MTDEAALGGRIVDGRHLLNVRVYYEDTDFSGFVYHANSLKFCERGRSDFLRVLGIHHSDLIARPDRLAFVVRRLGCEFLAPARIDDLLTVETRPGEIAGARMELIQRIRRGETVLFEARVLIVVVAGDGRPRRLPEDVRKRLESALDKASGPPL